MLKLVDPPMTAPLVPSLKELGQLIRARRRVLGLRIDDAADHSGVSVDLMSRLENGKTGVSSASLFRVLDGLGLVLLVAEKTEAAMLVSAARTPPLP